MAEAAMEDENSNYAQTGMHFEMINDKIRTQAYCKAIELNQSAFQGKVVLDIGCGTGILSLFAARAGARKVYAVECTPIWQAAAQIVKDNHFEDRITIIHGRMEDVTIPEKVDIIVSEWMGYTLYFEVFLPVIVEARNKYLNPGGFLLPSKASLYISAIEACEYRMTQIDFWDSVYGFDFREMKRRALMEPVVEDIGRWQFITNHQTISSIDIHTCSPTACFFKAPFALTASAACECDAIVTWFDVFFDDMEVKRVLSTSPFRKSTHWHQTQFFLNETLNLKQGDVLNGEIEFKPNPKDGGCLIIVISYGVNDGPKTEQLFDFR